MATQYEREVEKYGKKDALTALGLYALLFAGLIVSGIINSVLVGLFIFFIFIGSVIYIAVKSKKGLASIGIHKRNLLPALTMGIVVMLVIFIPSLIRGLRNGYELLPALMLLLPLLLIIIAAAFEDIFFWGFLFTRLHGIIKPGKKIMVVTVFLFAVVHLPVSVATGQVHLFNIPHVISMLLAWFIAGIILLLLFKSYLSVFPVIMLHTIINFSFRIWVVEEGVGMNLGLPIIPFLVLFIGICLWNRRLNRIEEDALINNYYNEHHRSQE